MKKSLLVVPLSPPKFVSRKGALLLVALLIGCVPMPPELLSHGGTVEYDRHNDYSDSITGIKFQSHDYLLSELKKKAELNFWNHEKTKEEEDRLSPGGRLLLDVERPTIDAANMDNFTVIIVENGKELFREAGKDKIANVPSGSSRWWNLQTFGIPKKMTSPFTVYVVDNLEKKRYEFRVTPDSTTREIVK
ncbi:MAG: hypothetical protein V1495_03400 [Pseudomonadota bacterium]